MEVEGNLKKKEVKEFVQDLANEMNIRVLLNRIEMSDKTYIFVVLDIDPEKASSNPDDPIPAYSLDPEAKEFMDDYGDEFFPKANKEKKVNFVEKLEDINRRQKKLDKEKKELKNLFECYIKDRSIPISQRWKVFVEADDKFKNHLTYLPNPRGPELTNIIDNFKSAPECYGRGKRINTATLFEDCYDEGKFYPQAYCCDDELENKEDYTEEELNKTRLFAFYEEILQANLGSFCYDW